MTVAPHGAVLRPLRFVATGSVDSGKSTIIGRLLHDSKSIFEDQLAAVERSSREAGLDHVNLALLTDGLRAERERGITIDVAYRYFATPRRKFIIADCPGHTQYTRNMVTGASTASLALILTDVLEGVVEQTRRHAVLASLLGIRELVLCVNKMDLAGYRQDRFEGIRQEFEAFALGLDAQELGALGPGAIRVTAIPVSALSGDHVVDRSERMPWCDTPPLLRFLEEVETEAAGGGGSGPRRFPVQNVIRAAAGGAPWYAGSVAGGVFRPGDEVVALPSGRTTRIESVETATGPIEEAAVPRAVTLRLRDSLEIARGDMIADVERPPAVSRQFDATICWLSDHGELAVGRSYWLKHTTNRVRARVVALYHHIDINTLAPDSDTTALTFNQIGLVRLEADEPLYLDRYAENRGTGAFILIDESSNDTVAAGMVETRHGEDAA